MRIGILTFHWATNYGAVLQTYALQTYLESIGHTVNIINYKPKLYDDTIWSFVRLQKFRNVKGYLSDKKKEKTLTEFRSKYLHQTSRVYGCQEIPTVIGDLDMVISGSDQVLNPSFLMNGDNPRVLTPSYFLGFAFQGKKIGYAVSFGCTQYPTNELDVATQYIKCFDKVSVRENSGLSILQTMGRNDGVVVPDPTSLLNSQTYQAISDKSKFEHIKPYTYCFFIRHFEERKEQIKMTNAIWNSEDGNFGLEDWLAKINNAEFVVTDSFHCVMMCLKLHTPFVVLSEWEGNDGMNDRLLTILDRVGQTCRLLHLSKIGEINSIKTKDINWEEVDSKIEKANEAGVLFLKSI